jgi:hypothetical protein
MKTTSGKAFETHVEEVLVQGSGHPGTNAEWDVERAAGRYGKFVK